MKRTHIARLTDIAENADAIRSMIDGSDFGSYRNNFQLRKAVERCLEIISEASRSIPEELKASHPHIPWRDVAAIGNLLRHEYQRVDDFVIWSIAVKSLLPLRLSVAAMLENAN